MFLFIHVDQEEYNCIYCKDTKEKDYGFVAKGIYPDVEEYYRGIDECDYCK